MNKFSNPDPIDTSLMDFADAQTDREWSEPKRMNDFLEMVKEVVKWVDPDKHVQLVEAMIRQLNASFLCSRIEMKPWIVQRVVSYAKSVPHTAHSRDRLSRELFDMQRLVECDEALTTEMVDSCGGKLRTLLLALMAMDKDDAWGVSLVHLSDMWSLLALRSMSDWGDPQSSESSITTPGPTRH